jgi:hypothetical protein
MHRWDLTGRQASLGGGGATGGGAVCIAACFVARPLGPWLRACARVCVSVRARTVAGVALV